MIKTILFDLDGTLADTAPDLADALNTLLRHHGREPLAYERIRPVVSHGGRALIELGFGIDDSDRQFEPLRQEFLSIYKANVAAKTTVFDGMDAVLRHIRQQALGWGVVTNKPGWLTDPLMAELDLQPPPTSIVSGDTLPQRKPHPAPLLYACEASGSRPEQCVYIGDAQRDIEAGRAAGMHTLVALFGYIGDDEKPDTWGADALLRAPLEIIDWLDRQNRNKPS